KPHAASTQSRNTTALGPHIVAPPKPDCVESGMSENTDRTPTDLNSEALKKGHLTEAAGEKIIKAMKSES
ncbi:MAG TPA: hypothetical protein VF591_01305, partial [Pyrinomonadaceae bacterium]